MPSIRSTTRSSDPITGEALRVAFDMTAPLTIGLEEEVMLLDPETLDLAPVADALLARVDSDTRFKRELPAAQIELVTAPGATVGQAVGELVRARRDLAAEADGIARLAGAGLHPFAAAEGALSVAPRYARIEAEYGPVARRQIVFALHVHVAVGGADRTLAVHNALRSYLPVLAALAANAPYYEGRDTGLASARPLVSDLLPRQGVPPPIRSWEAFAQDLRWGAAVGTVPEPGQWWFELRPHPRWGTLEVRVCDTQPTITDTAAIAAVVHALVGHLIERHDAKALAPPAASWRIEENRWVACRHGLEGSFADLQTGERTPVRECLHALLDELGPTAARLGCESEMGGARDLVLANGAVRQRKAGGAVEATKWLEACFLDGAGEVR